MAFSLLIQVTVSEVDATKVKFGPTLAGTIGNSEIEVRLQYPIRPGQLLVLLTTLYPALDQLRLRNASSVLVQVGGREATWDDLIFDEDAVELLQRGASPE